MSNEQVAGCTKCMDGDKYDGPHACRVGEETREWFMRKFPASGHAECLARMQELSDKRDEWRARAEKTFDDLLELENLLKNRQRQLEDWRDLAIKYRPEIES